MKLKDALEIVLSLAEDNALNLQVTPDVLAKAKPATVEANQAQQEALHTVRRFWDHLPEIP